MGVPNVQSKWGNLSTFCRGWDELSTSLENPLMSWGPLRPRSVAPREHGDGRMMDSYVWFELTVDCRWMFWTCLEPDFFSFLAPKKTYIKEPNLSPYKHPVRFTTGCCFLGVVLPIIYDYFVFFGGSMLSTDLHLPSRRWTPPRSSSSQGSRFDCFSDWFGRKQKELTNSQNAKS